MTKEDFNKLGLTQGQSIVIVLTNGDRVITYFGYISHDAGINYCEKLNCDCEEILFYTLHHSPFTTAKKLHHTLDLSDIEEIILVKLEKSHEQ